MSLVRRADRWTSVTIEYSNDLIAARAIMISGAHGKKKKAWRSTQDGIQGQVGLAYARRLDL